MPRVPWPDLKVRGDASHLSRSRSSAFTDGALPSLKKNEKKNRSRDPRSGAVAAVVATRFEFSALGDTSMPCAGELTWHLHGSACACVGCAGAAYPSEAFPDAAEEPVYHHSRAASPGSPRGRATSEPAGGHNYIGHNVTGLGRKDGRPNSEPTQARLRLLSASSSLPSGGGSPTGTEMLQAGPLSTNPAR